MKKKRILCLLFVLLLSLTACASSAPDASDLGPVSSAVSSAGTDGAEEAEELEGGGEAEASSADEETAPSEESAASFSLSSIPGYSDEPYVVVNDGVPYFTEDEYTTEAFEIYSELDDLGRCGVAYADICIELMPTEDRESISDVYPSGWNNRAYDFVDGGYVYNRCHLIGFQLAGENANELDLITGTRYLNVEGMLPFENMVADYVRETEHHVLYRVTPVFDGDDLVASGVLMEAWSVEDEGEGICFCVYAYNVQPGVSIDYATGENWADETDAEDDTDPSDASDESSAEATGSGETTYILNTNTMKFHDPGCSSVDQISEANRVEYVGSREDLIEQGYEPCGNCDP